MLNTDPTRNVVKCDGSFLMRLFTYNNDLQIRLEVASNRVHSRQEESKQETRAEGKLDHIDARLEKS
jgi:hypothetical protein